MDKNQFAEFASRVIANLPRDIPSGYASHLIGNPDILRHALERVLLAPPNRINIPALPPRDPRKWERFQFAKSLVQDRAPTHELRMGFRYVRRGEIKFLFLGLQHAIWIEENQDRSGAFLWPKGLEIHFPATTAQDANGTQYMPALVQRPRFESYMLDWVPAEKFGRGDAYVAIAE
jgi:hypothetical protein